MVEFIGVERFDSKGPCIMLLREKKQEIVSLIEKTDKTGNEYIVNAIEHEGGIDFTESRSGDETSINKGVSSSSMMDALSLASQVVSGGGSVGSDEFKRHEIHTHPKGHVGMSLADLKSYASKIVEGGDLPDSALVAVDTGGSEIVLGGIYKTREIDDNGANEVQNGLGIANMPDRAQLSHSEREEELLFSLEEVGIETCQSSAEK